MDNIYDKRKSIVAKISETMHRIAPTAQTILFGSEARGDSRPDSDIDLLILLDEDHPTLAHEEHVTLPLYEIELQNDIAINPIVISKRKWESRPFKTPFYINIINEGIVL